MEYQTSLAVFAEEVADAMRRFDDEPEETPPEMETEDEPEDS